MSNCTVLKVFLVTIFVVAVGAKSPPFVHTGVFLSCEEGATQIDEIQCRTDDGPQQPEICRGGSKRYEEVITKIIVSIEKVASPGEDPKVLIRRLALRGFELEITPTNGEVLEYTVTVFGINK